MLAVLFITAGSLVPQTSNIPITPAANKDGFADALVNWYHANARDLPWRKGNSAYEIWLSEIMLQQTQVVTVIPYFYRFLKKFPTVSDLAKAPVDAVLKQWEGLGYYSRARNLHKAAQQVVAQHGGQFPETLEEMNALPGIGRSTAGAILTFAMGQQHPLLDGNVKRVLSRLYDIDKLPNKVETQMWEYSTELLLQTDEPYSFNQAIMELGATLCTGKHPQCLVCPVKAYCTAAANGTQYERPVKATKKPVPHHNIGAAVIWHKGKVLIQQRPKEGLLGGLWEFPGGKQEAGETIEETVTREITEELAMEVTVGDKVATVKHAYSHFKITLHAYHCTWVSGKPTPHCADDWAWVAPKKLNDYAFPKANLKVIEALLK